MAEEKSFVFQPIFTGFPSFAFFFVRTWTTGTGASAGAMNPRSSPIDVANLDGVLALGDQLHLSVGRALWPISKCKPDDVIRAFSDATATRLDQAVRDDGVAAEPGPRVAQQIEGNLLEVG